MLDELDKNPLWSELPVVEEGPLVKYDMEMTYGSPSGQMAFLETVADALEARQSDA